jgi:hypothetical protein
MANVYVEARPKGRPEGSRIEDYVVETQGDQVLGTFGTQRAGIDWSKANGHTPTSLAFGTSMIRRGLIIGGPSETR